MDYHSMSLVELKEEAKNHRPKIKQYYIKSRLELIQILSMKELPQSFILEKKTIQELKEEAKQRGFQAISKLKRADLIELLYPGSKKNNQNNDHAKKHDDPEQGKGE